MVFLDRYGWPVTTFKGRPITNLIRRILYTRKIVKYWVPPEWVGKAGSEVVEYSPVSSENNSHD